MENLNVGLRLKESAEKARVSQAEIAEKLQKTRSFVSAVFAKNDCQVSTMYSFVQAIGCGIEEIFPELSKPQPQGLPDYLVRLADLQHEKILRLEEEMVYVHITGAALDEGITQAFGAW